MSGINNWGRFAVVSQSLSLPAWSLTLGQNLTAMGTCEDSIHLQIDRKLKKTVKNQGQGIKETNLLQSACPK